MIDLILHSPEEGPSDRLEFDDFDRAADAVRIHIVPEIANAIDDATSDGGHGMKAMIKRLTDILAKLCSPSMDIVIGAVEEWKSLVLENGLGYGWVEWLRFG
jgi:hypothetical protein